jgi:glycosyltransferase involved in cell wall biosynthesis
MERALTVDVIIPAYNEAGAIGRVVRAVPRRFAVAGGAAPPGGPSAEGSLRARVRHVVVVDNRSTDGTGAVAAEAGAVVLREETPGYGNACLRGAAWLRALPEGPPDVLAFLDGDYSDHPEQLPDVVAPIAAGTADLVIGSRALGRAEPGAITPQQVFGNRLAVFLLRRLYGVRYTDLGPFRAIAWPAYEGLGMRDRNYGWTVEMQVKAAKAGLRGVEVPVDYRNRIGTSKVSGTLRGAVGAGYKILLTIVRYL